VTTPVVCANCGAPLNRQWWDASKRAFDCRSCGYLTGPQGEPMGKPERKRIDRRLVVFIVFAVVALILLYLFVPGFRELG
jgi:hypothetical protein